MNQRPLDPQSSALPGCATPRLRGHSKVTPLVPIPRIQGPRPPDQGPRPRDHSRTPIIMQKAGGVSSRIVSRRCQGVCVNSCRSTATGRTAGRFAWCCCAPGGQARPRGWGRCRRSSEACVPPPVSSGAKGQARLILRAVSADKRRRQFGTLNLGNVS